MGKSKNIDHFNLLKYVYFKTDTVSNKREIASSIGRYAQLYKDDVYFFIEDEIFKKNYMEVVYQFYRTILYNISDIRYAKLCEKVDNFYKNEVMDKMKKFYFYKKNKIKLARKDRIQKPLILEGNSAVTLKKIEEGTIDLIFTSPPYYNAREYANYISYNNYLDEMSKVLKECYRVLDEGRFIIINVSPVITKRPGR